MAHLNHKGTEEKGPKTGRKSGLCKMKPDETFEYQLGQGIGAKRKADDKNCKGKGKRLKASKIFE